MGRKIEIAETSFYMFERKMEKPQRAALEGDWNAFKKFFEQDRKAIVEPMDLNKNNALHVATRSNKPQLIAELLDMLPVHDRWRALRQKSAYKNTILHQAVLYSKNVEIVDMLLRYEKEVPPPPPDQEIDDEPQEKQLPLLEMKNYLGETPLYRAAKVGNLKMLQHMAQRVADLQLHFIRDSDKTPILHAAIITLHLDVAVWLMKVDENLAYEKDDKGLTGLQLLSSMPSVFRSHSNLGTAKSLIYSLLPEDDYDLKEYDESISVIRGGRDLEQGKQDERPPTIGFSRINYAFWKFLAKEWDAVDRFWKTKRLHILAERLADLLVQKDESWHKTCVSERIVVVLPIIKPTNVAARIKLLGDMQSPQPTQQTPITYSYSAYTPLLLAASKGIIEIVEKIIEMYPEAINHVSEDELNTLHVAVVNRQKNIYRLLKRYGVLRRLGDLISNKGRTLLHQVATIEYYRGGQQAGITYELQEELRWFERVKKIIPHHFVMHCGEDNLTAKELFEIEHADMLKEAQDWIKETAQSCSAVAVLVATVVFAAAYTVPGGTDARGYPVFLHSPVFLFFTIMDVVALASSLASVVMFLSILTSPFEMWEFYKSLPRKLTLGFSFLFFSLTTTMLSFSATVLLTIRLESNKWSSSLIYSAAFFPVSIFALLQFPFYMAIKGRLMQFLKKLKKLVPRRLMKSTNKKKHL
ncbi:PGG domain [Sesbania bispinosa]|nr:PGG domain [Sesbania bispinosa]